MAYGAPALSTLCADTYGYPGPEGPRFYTMLGILAAIVFLTIAVPPEVLDKVLPAVTQLETAQ